MTTVKIGAITFAGQYDRSAVFTGFYFTELKDWNSVPPSKAPNTPRPNAHGSFDGGPDWREGAVPSLEGGYIGTDEADALAAMDELKNSLAIGSKVPMDVDNPLGVTTRQVSIRFVTIPNHRGGRRFTCSIDTFAPDPLRYGPPVRVYTGLPISGGGLTWPLTWPITWSAGGSDGRILLANPGNADTVPLLEVTGGLELGFAIDEVGSGRQVRFERFVPLGSTIFMNPRTGRAYIDAPGNDVSGFITRADWPALPKRGQTILQFRTLGAATGTPTLTGEVSPAFW